MAPMGKRGMLAVIALICAATLAFDAFFGHHVYTQVKATRFPVATGTITRSEINHQGDIYVPIVEYAYTVAGLTYQGDRVEATALGTSEQSDAASIVTRFPLGSNVSVYYDAADPQSAILMPGVHGSVTMPLLIMWPFNALALLCAVSLIEKSLGRKTGPGRWTLRRRSDGLVLRPASAFMPLYVGIMASGLTAFVAVFPVVFIFGARPSLAVPGVGVGAIVTVSVAAGVAFWARGAGRARGLVVDEARGELTFLGIATSGPIRFGDVHDISTAANTNRLAMFEQAGIFGTMPTVTYADQSGNVCEVQLPATATESDAVEVCDWIRVHARLADVSESRFKSLKAEVDGHR